MANPLNSTALAAAALCIGGVSYLVLLQALAPWIRIPDIGNGGFTAVFVLFALLHCAAVEGWRRAWLFFATSAAISFLMEEIGVTTGLIFGQYRYGASLGMKLGDVPVMIPLAWFLMMYPALRVAQSILRGVELRRFWGVTGLAAVAACVMTGWDAVMDPEMVAEGDWIWVKGGAYFGVPGQNYAGWLLTTFLVFWITGWLWRRGDPRRATARWFEALPVMLYGLFALRYVGQNVVPGLRVVAVFSMGLPLLVAGIQLCLNYGVKPSRKVESDQP